MKRRHLLMGAALLAAAGLVLFGETTPQMELAEPVERAAAPRPAARPVATAATPASGNAAILRLVPRDQLIGATGEGAFGGADVFQGQNWNPAPSAAAAAAAAANAAPPPPPVPTAPPLPFTVLGKGIADGAWEVYLARPDRTYVAKVGTVIDGMYRVDAIAPPTLTVTYLPLKQVQQLNIGVMD
jgi:pyruvate/2-oxoglutarate dehydrogenase complex dihydrolipoamide acyltransferase (E2) component